MFKENQEIKKEQIVEFANWANGKGYFLEGLTVKKVNLEKTNKIVRINELTSFLANTDYQAIKYFEGWISEEEYKPIKAQRQQWRDEINKLENEISN